jgi:hypothetical protein
MVVAARSSAPLSLLSQGSPAPASEGVDFWLSRATSAAALQAATPEALIQIIDADVFQHKAVRKGLHALYIHLLKHAPLRTAFGLAFAAAFPRVMLRWASGIGLSRDFIGDLSVQLYTVTTIGNALFALGEMPRGVMSQLWRLLSVAVKTRDPHVLLQGAASALNCVSADGGRSLGAAPCVDTSHHFIVHDRVAQLTGCLLYLLRIAGASNGVARDATAVALVAHALQLLSGMDPQQRTPPERGHVEFESVSWKSSFQIAVQMHVVTATLLDGVRVSPFDLGAGVSPTSSGALPETISSGQAAGSLWACLGALVEHAALRQVNEKLLAQSPFNLQVRPARELVATLPASLAATRAEPPASIGKSSAAVTTAKGSTDSSSSSDWLGWARLKQASGSADVDSFASILRRRSGSAISATHAVRTYVGTYGCFTEAPWDVSTAPTSLHAPLHRFVADLSSTISGQSTVVVALADNSDGGSSSADDGEAVLSALRDVLTDRALPHFPQSLPGTEVTPVTLQQRADNAVSIVPLSSNVFLACLNGPALLAAADAQLHPRPAAALLAAFGGLGAGSTARLPPIPPPSPRRPLGGGCISDPVAYAMLLSPLRAAVMHAQMKARMWVRNGAATVAQQCHVYETVQGIGRDADLLAIQTALLWMTPTQAWSAVTEGCGIRSYLEAAAGRLSSATPSHLVSDSGIYFPAPSLMSSLPLLLPECLTLLSNIVTELPQLALPDGLAASAKALVAPQCLSFKEAEGLSAATMRQAGALISRAEEEAALALLPQHTLAGCLLRTEAPSNPIGSHGSSGSSFDFAAEDPHLAKRRREFAPVGVGSGGLSALAPATMSDHTAVAAVRSVLTDVGAAAQVTSASSGKLHVHTNTSTIREATLRGALRRELVHALAPGPLPRSALSGVAASLATVGRALDESLISSVLSEIATFRPPTGMGSDGGLYVLREAVLLHEFDCTFPRMDAGHAVEAKEAWLAKRRPTALTVSPDAAAATTGSPPAALRAKTVKEALETARPLVPSPPSAHPAYLPVRSILHSVAAIHALRAVLQNGLVALGCVAAGAGSTESTPITQAGGSAASLSLALHLLTLAVHTWPRPAGGSSAVTSEETMSDVLASSLVSATLVLPFGGPSSVESTESVAGAAAASSSIKSAGQGWAARAAAALGVPQRQTASPASSLDERDLSIRRRIPHHTAPNVVALLYELYRCAAAPVELREGAAWLLHTLRSCHALTHVEVNKLMGADLESAAAAERAEAEAARKAQLDARKKAAQARAMANMAKQQAAMLSKYGHGDDDEDEGKPDSGAGTSVGGVAAPRLVPPLLRGLLGAGPEHAVVPSVSSTAVPQCILCGESDAARPSAWIAFAEPSNAPHLTGGDAAAYRMLLMRRSGLASLAPTPVGGNADTGTSSAAMSDAASAGESTPVSVVSASASKTGDHIVEASYLKGDEKPLWHGPALVARQDAHGSVRLPAGWPFSGGVFDPTHESRATCLFVPTTTDCGTAVSFCGHVAHTACLGGYLQSATGRAAAQGASDVRSSRGEFTCPMCRGISNTLVPCDAAALPLQELCAAPTSASPVASAQVIDDVATLRRYMLAFAALETGLPELADASGDMGAARSEATAALTRAGPALGELSSYTLTQGASERTVLMSPLAEGLSRPLRALLFRSGLAVSVVPALLALEAPASPSSMQLRTKAVHDALNFLSSSWVPGGHSPSVPAATLQVMQPAWTGLVLPLLSKFSSPLLSPLDRALSALRAAGLTLRIADLEAGSIDGRCLARAELLRTHYAQSAPGTPKLAGGSAIGVVLKHRLQLAALLGIGRHATAAIADKLLGAVSYHTMRSAWASKASSRRPDFDSKEGSDDDNDGDDCPPPLVPVVNFAAVNIVSAAAPPTAALPSAAAGISPGVIAAATAGAPGPAAAGFLGSQDLQASAPTTGGAAGAAPAVPPPAPGTWVCHVCTLINEPGDLICAACEEPQAGGPVAQIMQVLQQQGGGGVAFAAPPAAPPAPLPHPPPSTDGDDLPPLLAVSGGPATAAPPGNDSDDDGLPPLLAVSGGPAAAAPSDDDSDGDDDDEDDDTDDEDEDDEEDAEMGGVADAQALLANFMAVAQTGGAVVGGVGGPFGGAQQEIVVDPAQLAALLGAVLPGGGGGGGGAALQGALQELGGGGGGNANAAGGFLQAIQQLVGAAARAGSAGAGPAVPGDVGDGNTPANRSAVLGAIPIDEYRPLLHCPIRTALAQLVTRGRVAVDPDSKAPFRGKRSAAAAAASTASQGGTCVNCTVDVASFLLEGTSATAQAPQVAGTPAAVIKSVISGASPSLATLTLPYGTRVVPIIPSLVSLGDVKGAMRLFRPPFSKAVLNILEVNPAQLLLLAAAVAPTRLHISHWACLGYVIALAQAAVAVCAEGVLDMSGGSDEGTARLQRSAQAAAAAPTTPAAADLSARGILEPYVRFAVLLLSICSPAPPASPPPSRPGAAVWESASGDSTLASGFFAFISRAAGVVLAGAAPAAAAAAPTDVGGGDDDAAQLFRLCLAQAAGTDPGEGMAWGDILGLCELEALRARVAAFALPSALAVHAAIAAAFELPSPSGASSPLPSASAAAVAAAGAPSPIPRVSIVWLPASYDALYGRLSAATCLRCEQRPDTPLLCLLCGCIVCGGSACCKRGGVGEATEHTWLHHAGAGAFLILPSSATLLVRGEFAAYAPSLYVDAHGEQDIGLRRGRPLTLSQARADALSELAAHAGIAREVARLRSNSDHVVREGFY